MNFFLGEAGEGVGRQCSRRPWHSKSEEKTDERKIDGSGVKTYYSNAFSNSLALVHSHGSKFRRGWKIRMASSAERDGGIW